MFPRCRPMPAWGLLLLPLALQLVGEARQATPPAAQSADYFETKVRPVLAANCYDCHADQRMGGLRVDSREGLTRGGKSGPAIAPGDPEKSLLIAAVRQTSDTLKMPKGGRLKPDEIEALVEWIRAGAVWPNSAAAASPAAAVGTPAPTAAASYIIKPEQRAFWSIQPLHSTAAPAVVHAAWPKTDIDRFILAKLEKEGLAP